MYLLLLRAGPVGRLGAPRRSAAADAPGGALCCACRLCRGASRVTGFPQPAQKAAPSGTSAPQLVQYPFILRAYLLAEDCLRLRTFCGELLLTADVHMAATASVAHMTARARLRIDDSVCIGQGVNGFDEIRRLFGRLQFTDRPDNQLA